VSTKELNEVLTDLMRIERMREVYVKNTNGPGRKKKVLVLLK
jgi:hypothetical protein